MAEQLPLRFAFNPELGFQQYHSGANTEIVAHLKHAAGGYGDPLIFLWGESGTGKSHLLNACCREACQSDLSVSYLPLTSLREYGPAVLDGLEHQDIVCLDDVDSIAGDDVWEQALFSLFNRLRELGNRLIVAAQAPPGELPIRLPDLKTRLGWGLTLRLQPLNDEDKLIVLGSYARSLGLDLPPQVGRFLLSHYRRDLSSLRRLLDELDHATLAAKRKLTIPFLKSHLEETT
ncbi:DnaA regulatory inactivator Hda [Methylocaldum sp.]|uniref:DnaA regulatory inactivator Hda n=1 Tax=Methylocaldum sp. TaxID=1969727 RepID=UPI002D3D99C9|nr:DnaA regulatory inactivator Hda [Methylocaldum sp.]HYE37454.1 DnaA regulatory inactivator Hda [Methylocaldum sp.]